MNTNEFTTGYETLGADINKAPGSGGPDTAQGVIGGKLPELTLDMEDKEIIKITNDWQTAWDKSEVKAEWMKAGQENEKYWLGKQYEGPGDDGKQRPMVDNLMFESLETYLPQATRRNPDPMVELATGQTPTEFTNAYVSKVKLKLGELGDKNRLRLKLKKGARHWSIYLLGAWKYGWDLDRDIPVIKVVRPTRLILDPKATVDEDGYTGQRIGEHRKLEVAKLVKFMERAGTPKETIKKLEEMAKDEKGVEGGTEIGFIEWWTPEYTCWTLKDLVLLKKKNPHWNYDRTENPAPTDIASPGVQVDDYGNTTAQAVEVKGINHHPVPKMPYTLLSVFQLGDQPVDKTSLMGQNLANQDRINKLNKQINKNVDAMNGGFVVSMERSGLDATKAKNVSNAIAKGGTIVIPTGAPKDAVERYAAPALPADVYSNLADTRARMRDIFGTRGSSAAGVQSEQTVRGKILARGLDTDRIGGGISEYLEQVADDMYNWLVQMLYVYDQDFQFLNGGTPPKIEVSVKEGSLLPKDSTTIANQAIELTTAGKMAVIDLYKRLEYPNPEELAANVWLEVNAPEVLYQSDPRVAQAVAMRAAAAQAAADAKALNEASAGQLKHEQTMEREQAKAAAKGGGAMEGAREAALSNVDQENA